MGHNQVSFIGRSPFSVAINTLPLASLLHYWDNDLIDGLAHLIRFQLTLRSHMVCMLPWVASVSRCGQHSHPALTRERGTETAVLIPAAIFSSRLVGRERGRREVRCTYHDVQWNAG